jgi:hypothetical protein
MAIDTLREPFRGAVRRRSVRVLPIAVLLATVALVALTSCAKDDGSVTASATGIPSTTQPSMPTGDPSAIAACDKYLQDRAAGITAAGGRDAAAGNVIAAYAATLPAVRQWQTRTEAALENRTAPTGTTPASPTDESAPSQDVSFCIADGATQSVSRPAVLSGETSAPDSPTRSTFVVFSDGTTTGIAYGDQSLGTDPP